MSALRIADEPDEVHKMSLARGELRRYETDGRDAGSPGRTASEVGA